MTESIQHKLDRVRPPRVQITYDVEIGDAIETRELPFVMGIMADLSGDRDSEKAVKTIKDRKFVEIDRDNFNSVMVDADPRIAAQVPNKLDGTNTTQLNVVIHFNEIDDFGPLNIIKQVEPMRVLFEARTRLKDLLAKLDGNDDLESMLQNILSNADARNSVKGDIDKAKPAAGGDDKPAKKK